MKDLPVPLRPRTGRPRICGSWRSPPALLTAMCREGLLREQKQARRHACCGVVSNVCCDVSAPKGTVFRLSAAPLPPPKPAIACTSWAAWHEPSMEPLDAVGGYTAMTPTSVPRKAAPVSWLLLMLYTSSPPVLLLRNKRSVWPGTLLKLPTPENCQ